MSAVVGGLRSACGRHHPGDRWLGPLTGADRRALAVVEGPALDVGCGPARHTRALAERGVPALGIDITPALIDRARPTGAPVLQRDVFERLPGEGRWGAVLLLDGNVGIGGDVASLLARVGALVRADGMVLVELEPSSPPSESSRVRVELDGVVGPWFGWARVPPEQLRAALDGTGLAMATCWFDEGRCFAVLRRRCAEAVGWELGHECVA